MKRPNSLWFIGLCCLFLTGCSSLRREVDPGIRLEQCDFEPTVAHYHGVLDELGPPARLTALPGGFAFIYEALSITEFQIGISGNTSLWQLLKMSFANTDLKRGSYMLMFNSDGVLLAAGTLQSKEGLGASGAMQALFSVDQIVDTSTYEDDHIDSVNWGASLLDPIASALNYSQNLNTGASGLEQSGTTTIIGQHSLEMR